MHASQGQIKTYLVNKALQAADVSEDVMSAADRLS